MMAILGLGVEIFEANHPLLNHWRTTSLFNHQVAVRQEEIVNVVSHPHSRVVFSTA